MEKQATRRQALNRLSGAAIGATAFLKIKSAMAQTTPDDVPPWKTEMRQLAPNVYAYQQEGGPGKSSQGVSTGGIVVGDDRVFVIDSLGAPLHTKAYLEAIRRVAPGKRMERILITHHHGDHIWGLPFFPKDIEIVAHEYCRDAMLATVVPGPTWEKREGWAVGGEERRVVKPTTTLNDRTTYYYGNTEVRLITLAPAHTFGDVMVHLPQYKILFAGDIAFHWVAPFLNNGVATKWIEAIDKILAMDVDVIVAGHGPIGTKKEIADTKQYLEMLKGEARLRFNAGMTPGRAAADIKLGRFSSWIGAQDRMPMNLVRLYAEFNGTLTPALDAEGVRKATEEFNAIKAKA